MLTLDNALELSCERYDYGDASIHAWLFNSVLTDEEVEALTDANPGYHGGPGNVFARDMMVRRTRTRTLVTQFIGWNV